MAVTGRSEWNALNAGDVVTHTGGGTALTLEEKDAGFVAARQAKRILSDVCAFRQPAIKFDLDDTDWKWTAEVTTTVSSATYAALCDLLKGLLQRPSLDITRNGDLSEITVERELLSKWCDANAEPAHTDEEEETVEEGKNDGEDVILSKVPCLERYEVLTNENTDRMALLLQVRPFDPVKDQDKLWRQSVLRVLQMVSAIGRECPPENCGNKDEQHFVLAITDKPAAQCDPISEIRAFFRPDGFDEEATPDGKLAWPLVSKAKRRRKLDRPTVVSVGQLLRLGTEAHERFIQETRERASLVDAEHCGDTDKVCSAAAALQKLKPPLVVIVAAVTNDEAEFNAVLDAFKLPESPADDELTADDAGLAHYMGQRMLSRIELSEFITVEEIPGHDIHKTRDPTVYTTPVHPSVWRALTSKDTFNVVGTLATPPLAVTVDGFSYQTVLRDNGRFAGALLRRNGGPSTSFPDCLLGDPLLARIDEIQLVLFVGFLSEKTGKPPRVVDLTDGLITNVDGAALRPGYFGLGARPPPVIFIMPAPTDTGREEPATAEVVAKLTKAKITVQTDTTSLQLTTPEEVAELARLAHALETKRPGSGRLLGYGLTAVVAAVAAGTLARSMAHTPQLTAPAPARAAPAPAWAPTPAPARAPAWAPTPAPAPTTPDWAAPARTTRPAPKNASAPGSAPGRASSSGQPASAAEKEKAGPEPKGGSEQPKPKGSDQPERNQPKPKPTQKSSDQAKPEQKPKSSDQAKPKPKSSERKAGNQPKPAQKSSEQRKPEQKPKPKSSEQRKPEPKPKGSSDTGRKPPSKRGATETTNLANKCTSQPPPVAGKCFNPKSGLTGQTKFECVIGQLKVAECRETGLTEAEKIAKRLIDATSSFADRKLAASQQYESMFPPPPATAAEPPQAPATPAVA